MFVEFDLGMEDFIQTNAAKFGRELRRYYVHKNALFLVVLRNDLTLSDICIKTILSDADIEWDKVVDDGDVFNKANVVDASIGWDKGTPGYVNNENIGKRHSKMTVYSISASKPEAKLSDIIKDVPQA